MKTKNVFAVLGVISLSSCSLLGSSTPASNHRAMIAKPAPTPVTVADARSQHTKVVEIAGRQPRQSAGWPGIRSKKSAIKRGGLKSEALLNFDILKYILEVAQQKRDNWISRDSLIPPLLSFKPVKKQDATIYPELIKGEFENTVDFEHRVSIRDESKIAKAQSLESEYQERLGIYQQALKENKLLIAEEKTDRLTHAEEVYVGYIVEVIDNILGVPAIKDLVYDADTEQFFATVYSKKTNFSTKIIVAVPIGEAQKFKDNLNYLMPDIEFDLSSDNSLYVSKISIIFKGVVYPTRIVKNALSINRRH
jgi:hypothetical protein